MTARAAKKPAKREPKPRQNASRRGKFLGEMFFDDENCRNCSRCYASVSTEADGIYSNHTSSVDIEIYPQDSPEHENAFVTLRCDRYIRPAKECTEAETTFEREKLKTLDIDWNQLEPFAAALSRAVANARARGFLPGAGR